MCNVINLRKGFRDVQSRNFRCGIWKEWTETGLEGVKPVPEFSGMSVGVPKEEEERVKVSERGRERERERGCECVSAQ
jgi:hypothetical protein